MVEKEEAGGGISEEEAAQYDRQIRLWGLEAQKRLRASRVLLVGMKGLGAEIAKNLILAGVKGLTMLDHEQVSPEDLGAQFLIRTGSLGRNRAEACLERAQNLNPMVEVKVDTENIEKKPESFFTQFDAVCLTCCSRDVIIKVDQICHKNSIKFFTGDVFAEEGAAGRKARGRPRLTESDRARRRLESRKKYDVRRVYLGEAHGPWVDLRRRSGWSDAKLAAYLISLERGQRSGRHGKPWEQVPKKPKRKKRRRRNVNCLKNVVIWYEDHKHRCPYEPHLAELDPTFGLYTTAVWQCEAGHRYFQDLHSPLKPLSDSDPDSDKVDNGLGAGSSNSSSSCSGSDSEEPPGGQPAKATVAAAAVTPTSPAGSSGLITQEGVHIPFDVHHVESLAEQGTALCPNPAGSGPEALETVVCVPVPMQVGPGPGTLFENMPQEALGEVVASCPMPGMVPGSQVIIIAGPGYDALTAEGIHLNVAAGSSAPSGGLGDEVPCTMMEGVAAYTQTEPEGSQPSTMDPTTMAGMETKKEKEDLYMLKKEEKEEPVAPELAELAATVPESAEPEAEADGEELDGSDMSAIIYEIPKEPEKRRRSKRSRVMDADGLLEMFHCPYEGCSQVYVALSSFQNHVNLVHRKGKTKVCPHPGCGKKFYLSNHLRRHMIIHSGVREFTCETCGKSFKRKNHLEVHRRTHTGETPLQCEICGYQCRQRASLNWHMKKHTAEVQYNFTCERCGKRFEKLDSIKFHTLKSHPDHKPA